MTPIRSIGSVDDRTLLEVARSAFLETCAADRRDGLTAHSLDTRGEVRFGDAALHELAEVSSTRRERLFVAGEARALLYVDVGVIHGRDDDIDASTAGFELSCGPMRIEKRHGEHLSTEGSAALRGRMERLLTQRAALRLSPTTPPSTPLDWNQRVLSCELYQRVPFDGGPVELAVASYGSRWFGVLLSSDFHYAPIGWIPRPTAPVMTDEAVSAHGERVLADLDALALALGLPPPVVLHRESFTADPESRSRGFRYDRVDVSVPRGHVDAAYGRSGDWHLRLARHTDPAGLRRWSFIAQDDRCSGMVRGSAAPSPDDATQLRVTLRSHGDRAVADALLAALGLPLSPQAL